MTAIPQRRPFPGRMIAGAGVALIVLLGLAALIRTMTGSPSTPVAPIPLPTIAPILEARGQVVPAQYARLGPITGAKVNRVLVVEGEKVLERQELLRLEVGLDLVSILAPFPGTVTSISTRQGETLLPGAIAVTVADLQRFVVETTDVDEFTIARIEAGQLATLRIDALSDTTFQGRVARVALMASTGDAGDRNFPVQIDIDSNDPRIRWGMSARITFGQ